MNSAPFPQKGPKARTGSNLRNKRWSEYWRRFASQQRRRSRTAVAEYRRTLATLLKKSEGRTARELIRRVKREWHASNFRAAGIAPGAARRKHVARQRLLELLGRAIPNFRRARTLQAKHFAALAELHASSLASRAGRVPLKGGGAITPLDGAEVFTAPFELFDYHVDQFPLLVVQDDSFVEPGIGHFIHNLAFEHNESDWGFYNPTAHVWSRASCGVRFTVPQEGRLRILAEIENVYNRINYSIRDNFGFSHANLTVHLELFVAVTRANADPIFHFADLFTEEVRSGGDDVTKTLSELDNSLPFGIEATTLQILPAGDSVEILGGVRVHISSDTDDMNAHVKPTLWWRLRKLSVAVV